MIYKKVFVSQGAMDYNIGIKMTKCERGLLMKKHIKNSALLLCIVAGLIIVINKLISVFSHMTDHLPTGGGKYYHWKYGKPLKPVQRRNGKSIPEDTVCPLCGAPHHFIYDNNGGNGQYQCKVCGQTFCSGDVVTVPIRLTCPHCGNTLVAKKDRKFFRIHKCVNPKCPYYLYNLKKVEQKDLVEDYGKNKYKLHYIYREFTVLNIPYKPLLAQLK